MSREMDVVSEGDEPPILLCCDLDRTLIPNGAPPESEHARARLRALCARPEVHLAFVSGRDLRLVLDGVAEWALPVPEFIIGDVGTTIYTPRNGDDWQHWDAWTAEIAPDWNGLCHADLAALFADITALEKQEVGKQGAFKLSYYVDLSLNREMLLAEVQNRLWAQGVNASLIWSVDEEAGTGLLDILPAQATKVHAIEFLISNQGYDMQHAIFCGDSGNDLMALVSPIRSVLVRNAHEDVKDEATRMVAAAGLEKTLYIARGDFLGMNGNYSAGVLEGVAHYLPETRPWMMLEGESPG
ncbi:MAG: HAD-IIB family hydrolase [Halothiobacillaceae bacterium]